MDAERLRGIPLFADLSRKEREQVARWADEVDVPAGRQLLEEGRLAYEFFVIGSGSVDVTRDGEPIAKLAAGDFFGEIALLDRDRRTASVVTAEPSRLIVMAEREFDAMVDSMPSVAERVRRAREQRAPSDD
jgi:CRP-like cAMP-binding protein